MFPKPRPNPDRDSRPDPGASVVKTICPPRPLRPGAYAGTIERCDLAAFSWRVTPRNPDGLVVRICVAVHDDAGEVAHVFDSIDADHVDRLQLFATDVGLGAGDGPLDQLASDSEGRPVRIITKNITPARGKHAGQQKAVVGSWVPSV